MSKRGSAADAVGGDDFATLQMIGCKNGEKITGTVTTHSIACFWTHWSGAKTLGHVNGVCPGCEAKIGYDFQAYVGIYNDRTRHHRLLRLTLGATRQILDAIGTLNGVRGLTLTVMRKKGKTNGRLMAECGMIFPDRSHLPQPFNPVDHLVRIWGLEYCYTVSKLNNVEVDPLRPFSGNYTRLFTGANAEDRGAAGALRGQELEGQLHLPDSG